VCAETTTDNNGALAILGHLHFDIEAIGGETVPVAGRPGGRVVLARLRLSRKGWRPTRPSATRGRRQSPEKPAP
jgi:hypothetical protein